MQQIPAELFSSPVNLNTVLLSITLLVSALSPVLIALLNLRITTIHKETDRKVDAAADRLAVTEQRTAEKLDEIKDTVNGEKRRLMERLELLHGEVVTLTRTAAAAAEVRTAVAPAQTPPTP